jgi:hypothetical protein
LSGRKTDPEFTVPLEAEGRTELFAERLRDGRIALGTRERTPEGWRPAELHLLDAPAYLALAAWLATPVEEAWIPTARERQSETLRTAEDLFGDGADAAERLASRMIGEIPPSLLRRAMLLLANAIGPTSRNRLVDRLNRTADFSEDEMIRRELVEADESLAYGVAAAALFDAIARGLAGPAAERDEGGG